MVTGLKGSKRVVRGGSWNNDARNLRAAFRNANAPDDRNENLGFRLARAHERVGRPVSDPIRVRSAGVGPVANSKGAPVCESRPRRARGLDGLQKLTGAPALGQARVGS
ncbi:MAG: SUMF1/EgtB/PvdO family nonheme iron enzyme [Planctomycetota bacterium]